VALRIGNLEGRQVEIAHLGYEVVAGGVKVGGFFELGNDIFTLDGGVIDLGRVRDGIFDLLGLLTSGVHF
jgi:hypothetical protein